jgi:thiamine-phosphate pyrophosphorylase
LKALYVTARSEIGDRRFREILAALRSAPALSVQLREKKTPDREVLRWGQTSRDLLGPGVPLYINRRFDLALSVSADGVHLPADGLPVRRVRAATPRGFRLGVSTHSPSEAREAIAGGADLVVIGPVFETPSKEPFGPPLSPDALRALPRLEEHSAEVYAIGGIDDETLPRVAAHRDRITGVAAIRWFQKASDPREIADRIAAA